MQDFFTNLGKFFNHLFGIPSESLNEYNTWNMPSGEDMTVSEPAPMDIDYATNNTQDGLIYHPSERSRFGTDETLQNWVKIPFTYETPDSGGRTASHTGYFVTIGSDPRRVRLGEYDGDNYIYGAVLDDGTQLGYEDARALMSNMRNNQKVGNFQILPAQRMTGNEFPEDLSTIGKNNYRSNPHYSDMRQRANTGTTLFNMQNSNGVMRLDPITQQHTDNFIEALRKLNNSGGGGGW